MTRLIYLNPFAVVIGGLLLISGVALLISWRTARRHLSSSLYVSALLGGEFGLGYKRPKLLDVYVTTLEGNGEGRMKEIMVSSNPTVVQAGNWEC